MSLKSLKIAALFLSLSTQGSLALGQTQDSVKSLKSSMGAASAKCDVKTNLELSVLGFSLAGNMTLGRYSPHGAPEVVAYFLEQNRVISSAQKYRELIASILSSQTNENALAQMRYDIRWMDAQLKNNPNIKWIGTEAEQVPGQDFETLITRNLNLLDEKMKSIGTSEPQRADILMMLFGSPSYFFYSRNLKAKGIRLISLESQNVAGKSDAILAEIDERLRSLKANSSFADREDIDSMNFKLNDYLTRNSRNLMSITQTDLRNFLSQQRISKALIPALSAIGWKWREIMLETKVRDAEAIQNILKTSRELGSGLFIYGKYHFENQMDLLKKSTCSR